ncbi:RNA polymerase sigma factor [Sphingopyxis sp. LC81]|uniref:RNA polymerase sigma factor n=1 Tax=Sphingopyxis sp. LC81 TaxID=1502850 RepID=UPI00137821A9|nr:RNA polymerase sigma factor [Sphingopyxis sp. LC81]
MQRAGEKVAMLQEQARMSRLHNRFRLALERYFSRRIGRRPDVDDLVQEVFERLMRCDADESDERVDGYVFATASSVLTDRHRRARARNEHLHQPFCPETHAGIEFSPEHVLANREQLARVSAVLRELPERTRAVFVLRRIEGMRYLDIASRLGISVSATEKHMQRAMVYITRRMDEA